MWIAVRETHLSVNLALWDPNKLTHPLQGPSNAKDYFEPEDKKAWRVLVMLWGIVKF